MPVSTRWLLGEGMENVWKRHAEVAAPCDEIDGERLDLQVVTRGVVVKECPVGDERNALLAVRTGLAAAVQSPDQLAVSTLEALKGIEIGR